MELNPNFTWHSPDLWESTDTKDLDAALLAFNLKFNSVERGATVNVPGRAARRYASLDGIMLAIRPMLAEQGLFIEQPIAGDRIITTIRHKSGQFRSSALHFVPMQGNGTNALQNMGGGFTYIKRYALSAMLAIATEEDDDGATDNVQPKARTGNQAPAPKPPATPKVDDEEKAIGMIRAAANLEELKTVWGQLSTVVQASKSVMEEKETRKQQLTTQPTSAA